MLYYFIKFLMKLVLPVYYRKMIASGLEGVPVSGPCLLACNHPNSFLDAIMIGAHVPRELHFLTRSDVFNAPWKKWILSKMNMVPIYRMRDGLDNLDKNQETFEKCREVFRAGGVILIFSEGICIQEFKLRPLKKGTARIALDFAQDGNSLTVIPVGLNYLHPMKFRNDIFIGLATPFNALEFRAAYQENAAKGILLFNRKLEALLRGQVIQVDESKFEKTIQGLFKILLNNQSHNLILLVALADRFNKRLKENPMIVQDLQNHHDSYLRLLEKYKLDDATIIKSKRSPLFLLNLLVFLPGFLLSYLPFSAIRRLVSRKVKLAEFYDSVLVAGGMIFSLLFTILAGIIIGATLGPGFAIAIVLIIYLSALTSVLAYDRLLEYRQSTRYGSLGTEEQREILDARARVLDFVEINLSRDLVPSSSPST
jgi:glycerol-3-phosphate O-acyltransferase / dihydroxyacetone phosphate acyltransferase